MTTLDIKIDLPQEVLDIAKAIQRAGGQALLVGGTVRDAVFNHLHATMLASKDIDIEVFGLPTEQLVTILQTFGRVDEVGKSFGVIKVTIGELDLDFSLPRTEKKVGVGHTGFEVVPDHTMTLQQAVLRRDFTINALAFDPLTGQLIDLVGGVEDIHNQVLRHVSDKFGEDPLRVMRAVQFTARFCLDMAEETIAICRSLLSEFHTLPQERLWIEWEKFLGKGIKISKGIDVLFLTGWFDMFPLDKASISHVTGQIQRMVGSTLSKKQRVIIGLALLETDFSCPLTTMLTDEKEVVREVKELMQMEFDSVMLTPCPLQLRTKLAIGLSLKHCKVSTAVAFFQCRNRKADWTQLQELEDDKTTFVRKVNGGDLIKAGWNPKQAKEAFGDELQRLFIIQLRENLSREELLTQINEPV
jgi:tRNA nucleotidyltransferase/poly(A) polymerase